MADSDARPRSAVALSPQQPGLFDDDTPRPIDPFEEITSFSESGEGFCGSDERIKEAVSRFSGYVVSLASFHGGQRYSACTGTVIFEDPSNIIILTSASLVGSLLVTELAIFVLLPNRQTCRGVLIGRVPHYKLAIVEVMQLDPPIRAAGLDDSCQFGPGSNVIAVERCLTSGKLMATAGAITDEPSKQTPKALMMSTCKITKHGIGGPVIDLDGTFVGMSFCHVEGNTPFLPWSKIHKLLVVLGLLPSRTLRVGTARGSDSTIGRSTGALQGLARVVEGVTITNSQNNYQEDSISLKRKRNSEGVTITNSQNKNQKDSISSKRKRNSEGVTITNTQNKNRKDSISCKRKRNSEEREYIKCTDDLFQQSPSFRPLPQDVFTDHLTKTVTSRGYPPPVTLDGGMHLLNSFEEKFAGEIWSKLNKEVALDISLTVVSLASFRGESRFFACTGVFLGHHKSTTRILTSASLVRASDDANEIADNLKIQVYLPSNRHAEGTLQHYNLHYNIAVVTISGFHCRRTAKFHKQVQAKPRWKVVAIGRVFQTGKIMATNGLLVAGQSKLDCKKLMVSTCKITKAGIGGPLIDFCGNFIGMNFYGTEDTPYLPGNVILKLLRHFDAKRTVADEVIDDPIPNRWPVPKPYWHYPSSVYYISLSGRRKL